MPSEKDVKERLVKAIQEKTGGQKPCSICGRQQWSVSTQFTAVTVSNDPRAIQLGGTILPSVPIICSHCGNTHFLNLLVLGFTDLAELKIDEDEKASS